MDENEKLASNLQAWEVIILVEDRLQKTTALLQSREHPEIGVWTYLRKHSTRLDVRMGTRVFSAVCACDSCWSMVGAASRVIHREAKRAGIEHIITRHAYSLMGMHEPCEEICKLFEWFYHQEFGCASIELK